MTIVPVTGVCTCGLYTKCKICMLWLVHEDHMTWGLHNKSWFTCYRYGYIVLVLVVQLHVMGLVESCSWLWLWTWNMILLYFSLVKCFRYGSFLLNLVLLVPAELISVCVSLHEYGSLWVWLENLKFSNCLLAISVQIFDLNSELETCTGTRIFDYELGLKTWIFN